LRFTVESADHLQWIHRVWSVCWDLLAGTRNDAWKICSWSKYVCANSLSNWYYGQAIDCLKT